MSIIISIDPGRSKCGLVLADSDSKIVLEGHVVKSEDVLEMIYTWKKQFSLERILLGNGTSSSSWYQSLKEISLITFVDERGTTLRARNRYYELWPPSKLMSLLPKGLLIPPDNLDAVAALLLLEDFLGEQMNWPGDIKP